MTNKPIGVDQIFTKQEMSSGDILQYKEPIQQLLLEFDFSNVDEYNSKLEKIMPCELKQGLFMYISKRSFCLKKRQIGY